MTTSLPDGRTIDIAALTQVARVRPVRLVRVTDLLWECESRSPRDPRTGFRADRYARADTRVPVLALPSGRVIDGRHRVCKIADLVPGGRVPVRTITDADLDHCTARHS